MGIRRRKVNSKTVTLQFLVVVVVVNEYTILSRFDVRIDMEI